MFSSLDPLSGRQLVARLVVTVLVPSACLALSAGVAEAQPVMASATPTPSTASAAPSATPAAAPAAALTRPASASSTAQPGDTTAASAPARFKVSGTDGEGLRVRDVPGLSAPIIDRLPEGTLVTLAAGVAREADGERWLPVVAEQRRGWVAARYLTRVVALTPVVRQLPPNASLGERVAATAESVLGQPYLWAGNAPGGFDCSGLVQWAYSQVGLAMPRTIPEQLTVGRKVDASQLRIGDLLAFTDTYQPGLSHVGIYLGTGRFVHAADEAHGVTINSLREQYWQPRFYRAVRLKP